MVLLKTGESLIINNRKFEVGSIVRANAKSIYEGKIGEIIEIRTDNDKETDNYGPDIYVDFEGDIVIMDEEMLEIYS